MSEVVVIGAGGIGPSIAAWLLRHADISQVTLADADCKRAENAVNRIATPEDIESGRCCWMYLDTLELEDHNLMPVLMRFDVVISAIPASFSPRLASLCIQAGTDFCDLGGVTDISRQMRTQLHQRAIIAEVSIVPDCGLMPGLGNMMAQDLVNQLGGADTVVIYVGGLPKKPQAYAGNYQRIFSIEGLKHILEPALVVRDGNLVEVPACSEQSILSVPVLNDLNKGFIETFITNGAGTAPEWFHRQGVKNFCERTIRWWGFLKFIQGIPRDQFVQVLERILPPTDEAHPDLVWMGVSATNGTRVASRELYLEFDAATGQSAMAQATGFTTAAIARRIAQGHAPYYGVFAPEEFDRTFIEGVLNDLSGDLHITS